MRRPLGLSGLAGFLSMTVDDIHCSLRHMNSLLIIPDDDDDDDDQLNSSSII